ncbi:MAG: NAD(P)/FAD-dependent oxidoreductase [bacterium]|nr:NAD(P)/FAD-dependent oxidoreductase [bacterium]
MDIIVIGGGPAGLSAAITAKDLGADVLLVDENHKIGGQLVKQTHKFFGAKQHWCGVRGINIANILFEQAQQKGVNVLLESSAVGIYNENNIKKVGIITSEKYMLVETKGIVIAAGAEENMLNFENNDLPGIYGAGAVQTLVNVYGIMPGKKVLMVGSGNIGLIVSYQLMQAGIDVVGIIEGLPEIGGYLVHASKIRRLGIPIYVSHTIKSAIGKESVENAIITKIDKNWQPVVGSEQQIDCDVICLAVGLTPSTELLNQAGCEMKYIPELGGYTACHNELLRTSIPGIYIAGDISGIEEAVTAILEGRVAGAACVQEILENKKADTILSQTASELAEFRAGPFGEKARTGKKKIQKQL